MNGDETMSKLNVLDAWREGISNFIAPKSAQGFMQPAMAFAASCGSSCGAGDDEKKEQPKPAACGSSCGTGDDEKKEPPKPSACGSACGAGDQK